jgi:uncharacterized protein YdiU (UPF0061 family)
MKPSHCGVAGNLQCAAVTPKQHGNALGCSGHNIQMEALDRLDFDNRFADLPEQFFSRVQPTPLGGERRLVSASADAAQLIGLDPAALYDPRFLDICSGHSLPADAEPLAMVYAGHQFGHYVPQLGDGRAILLGQVRNGDGELWDLHLKGAGLTPYSRSGDGRAVLRSSIREYLCSEAMHGLGIPTSRALGLVASSEEVYRERIEPGAMVLRLAPSHIRFGHFEYFYYRNEHDRLQPLADYLIEHHLPELRGSAEPYLALLQTSIQRTAELIAAWQSVGFCHGVMNTDNMAVLGFTLDYGPFGFLDAFDPEHICNHSDHHGRYAYKQQPQIAYWNLSCFAQALLPLLHEVPEAAAEKATALLETFPERFQRAWLARMRAKLGLREAHDEDPQLISQLLELLAANRVDMTIFFRRLGRFMPTGANRELQALFEHPAAFDDWSRHYAARLAVEPRDPAARKRDMDGVNPVYVLRNHLAETAIRQSEAGDDREVQRLLQLLRDPYREQSGMEAYAEHPPQWANTLAISCSS